MALALASCALALAIGVALFRTDPLAARSSSARSTALLVAAVATPSATATATIDTPPPATAPSAPVATPITVVPSSPARHATAVWPSATAPPPVPTAVSRVVVGRWQDRQVIITEAFSTRGPWRICWSRPDPAIPFQLMVGDAGQTAWEFYSAPVGATSGHFDLPQGGAFRLMIHGETPYEVTVFDLFPAGGASLPACG